MFPLETAPYGTVIEVLIGDCWCRARRSQTKYHYDYWVIGGSHQKTWWYQKAKFWRALKAEEAMEPQWMLVVLTDICAGGKEVIYLNGKRLYFDSDYFSAEQVALYSNAQNLLGISCISATWLQPEQFDGIETLEQALQFIVQNPCPT